MRGMRSSAVGCCWTQEMSAAAECCERPPMGGHGALTDASIRLIFLLQTGGYRTSTHGLASLSVLGTGETPVPHLLSGFSAGRQLVS